MYHNTVIQMISSTKRALFMDASHVQAKNIANGVPAFRVWKKNMFSKLTDGACLERVMVVVVVVAEMVVVVNGNAHWTKYEAFFRVRMVERE